MSEYEEAHRDMAKVRAAAYGPDTTALQLRDLRRALHKMRDAMQALRTAGLGVPVDMIATERELADEVVRLPVPCLMCKKMFGEPVWIGDPDESTPRTGICGPCDARITLEVKEGRS